MTTSGAGQNPHLPPPADAAEAVSWWQSYLAEGGTLADWSAAHPDGITPQ